ncbi:MAG: cupin domain-containing protein [Phycisphaerae bacterium]|nr:cupin domain-containing protein [Phycisphaerae bacterium]
MKSVNAISKVRFGSAKPQRVQLYKGQTLQAELICMEPDQQIKVASGEWTYYVVKGTASFGTDGEATELSAGQFAAVGPDESHSLSAAGEQRLICLAIGRSA